MTDRGNFEVFYEMITRSRDRWYASINCTVNTLVNYMDQAGKMRDAQIEAIRTFLYLKISCGNKPLADLFSEGAFNSLDLNDAELSTATREYLNEHPGAAALFEYAQLSNGKGEQVSKALLKQIQKAPESIDYVAFFRQVFYDVKYSDYLFSLPMGAGKTYLMAAFIYLDLYFAIMEPQNLAFAHNYIIFAPSGLKSSVVPSLRTIQNFNPAWILPEPAASNVKRRMIFEVLDEVKSAKKSNRTKNPNVQKIAAHQPLSDLFGLVAVTNAEKVILDSLPEEVRQLSSFEDNEDEETRRANELRHLISTLPSLSIYIDEVHHAVSSEIKLRAVVNQWANKGTFNSVIGFSGTPYLEKAEKFRVSSALSVASEEISNIVYYYPLIAGIGNFLKRPIVKISYIADSERIIEAGVREFLDAYRDIVYEGGLRAKLGIYCGTIEKLEEVVYPIAARIVTEYGISSSAILKFHRGNTKYHQPSDSQMQFDVLDKAISPIRIVLLVQIGKEGWDCRSLTGIILSQEGDCSRNMVLQTSCRCLRQVVKGTPETALVYLNRGNADMLNAQLKQQQHISLEEFTNAKNSQTILNRYDRTTHLRLPPIQYYQLQVDYETQTIETAKPEEQILKATDNAIRTEDVIQTTDFDMRPLGMVALVEEYGQEVTTFYAWLYGISKGSFGFVSMSQLAQHREILKVLIEKITYENEGVRYLSSRYSQSLIAANIRKAFYDTRSFTTREELIPQEANLLHIANFTSEVTTEKPSDYYPDQKVVKNIVLDDAGKLTISVDIEQLTDQLRKTGHIEMANILLKEHASHPQKDRSFHYLPYRTNSIFEQTFLNKVLDLSEIEQMDLEVYYNGDRALTEFKIRCFKFDNGKRRYIGMYTPDFLILKRKGREIHRVIIVETKGRIYANDPVFKDKKRFMEQTFISRNNEAFGFSRFAYLYLEDNLQEMEQIIMVRNKITTFFQEEQ